jgi:Zn/Cd-binding protein ZinT
MLAKDIFSSIRYKNLNGISIIAAGRLGKRLTASKAYYKKKKKGNLKTIMTSNPKVTLIRGNKKPNLQYTNLNSKTRNGAFGLKG